MKRRIPAFAVCAGALALAACSAAREVAAPPRSADASAGCPLGVPRTEVTIRDDEGGVAVTFVSRDHVEELRRRVLDVSAVHGPGAHLGVGHEGEHGIGQGHGLHLSDLPPMSIAFEEVTNGARLHFAAVDRDQVSTVKQEVRRRADLARTSACP